MDGLKEFPLWYAVGFTKENRRYPRLLGGVYYGTKEQCEAAVRKAYPDETPANRYARVFCKTFYDYEEV